MTDGRTDGWTDGRTDGGDCNIPNAFLKKRGDNNAFLKKRGDKYGLRYKNCGVMAEAMFMVLWVNFSNEESVSCQY